MNSFACDKVSCRMGCWRQDFVLIKETCDKGMESFVDPGPHPSSFSLTQRAFCREKRIIKLSHGDS